MRAERRMWCASFVMAGAFVVMPSVAATWTGAQDAFWTNSVNWAEGTVPGKYYAPDGTLTGATQMTATFGACSGTVEIDLDGLFSIGKVHVTGADARVSVPVGQRSRRESAHGGRVPAASLADHAERERLQGVVSARDGHHHPWTQGHREPWQECYL